MPLVGRHLRIHDRGATSWAKPSRVTDNHEAMELRDGTITGSSPTQSNVSLGELWSGLPLHLPGREVESSCLRRC